MTSQFPDGTLPRMIEIAIHEIGYVEEPDNHTKYGKTMHADGLAWCGSFLNWCAIVAKVKVPNTVSVIQGSQSFVKLGQLHIGGYQVGDFAYFNFAGKTQPQHVGLIVKVDDKNVYTIEGNTSGDKSQVNGGMVMLKKRDKKFVLWTGRPVYAAYEGSLPPLPAEVKL
jgi:hypothetical protein